MDDDRILFILLCIVGIVFILMGFIDLWNFNIILKGLFILIGFLLMILLISSSIRYSIIVIIPLMAILILLILSVSYMTLSNLDYFCFIFCFIAGLFLGLAYRFNLILKKFANENYRTSECAENNTASETSTMPDIPKKLDENNDCFGTLKKVDAIKKILRSEILDNHSTVALYGDWGSGKSSIILTLIDRLERDRNSNIIAIKFDAWKYEREESLSYALLEFIVNELEKNKDKRIRYKIKAIKDDVLKSGRIVLKSVGISLSPISLSFENKDVNYKDIEKLIKNIGEISKILKESNKKLIVFIDELDRCEPEHILELLSSLKAIFNASNDNNEKSSIIYFVAIDKEAVSKAIKTRYGDIIKAEEYLEKIFNVSFSMPKVFEIETEEGFGIKKFIMQYPFFNNDEIAEKLAKFFEAINFTNPRRLKKVLNKYAFLVKIKNSDDIDDKLKELIPKIITGNNNDEYLVDTVFVLYFIVLYEFYYDKYLEIKNIDDKLNNYAVYFRNIGWDEQKNIRRDGKPKKTNIELILKKYIDKTMMNKPIYILFEIYDYNNKKTNKDLLNLINIFTPMIKSEIEYNIYDISLYRGTYKDDEEKIRHIYCDEEYKEYLENNRYIEIWDEESKEYKLIKLQNAYTWKSYDEFYNRQNDYKDVIKSNINKYIEQFEYKNNEILIDFCKYLISEDFFEIIKADYEKGYNNENYKFKQLFDMVETLL